MKLVVTGGEGFIGRNVVRKLKELGHDTFSLDINGNPDYHISVLDPEKVRKAFEGAHGVIHLAATTSPPQFESDLNAGFQNNVSGTMNVLLAAAREKVKRVVFASSSATYGKTTNKASENMQLNLHDNLYPITKVVGEMLGNFFSIRGETEFVSLRYFNAYGPGENTKSMYSSVIWKFVKASLGGEDLVVFGDGKQSRDFVYVSDIADATVTAFEKGKNGECYNVGTGITTDFNSIAAMVKETLRTNSKIVHVENPLKNYQYFTLADISKIVRDTGWKPRIGLKEGIKMTSKGEIK